MCRKIHFEEIGDAFGSGNKRIRDICTPAWRLCSLSDRLENALAAVDCLKKKLDESRRMQLEMSSVAKERRQNRERARKRNASREYRRKSMLLLVAERREPIGERRFEHDACPSHKSRRLVFVHKHFVDRQRTHAIRNTLWTRGFRRTGNKVDQRKCFVEIAIPLLGHVAQQTPVHSWHSFSFYALSLPTFFSFHAKRGTCKSQFALINKYFILSFFLPKKTHTLTNKAARLKIQVPPKCGLPVCVSRANDSGIFTRMPKSKQMY